MTQAKVGSTPSGDRCNRGDRNRKDDVSSEVSFCWLSSPSLHVRGHEGIGALLGILRRPFVIGDVVSLEIDRLIHGHGEAGWSAMTPATRSAALCRFFASLAMSEDIANSPAGTHVSGRCQECLRRVCGPARRPTRHLMKTSGPDPTLSQTPNRIILARNVPPEDTRMMLTAAAKGVFPIAPHPFCPTARSRGERGTHDRSLCRCRRRRLHDPRHHGRSAEARPRRGRLLRFALREAGPLAAVVVGVSAPGFAAMRALSLAAMDRERPAS